MPEVTWLPAAFAAKIKEPMNVIAIGDPSQHYTYATEHKRYVRFTFYDDEHFQPPAGCAVATEETAREILAFIKSCAGEDILVHCSMGVSRSAAVAMFIASDLEYDPQFGAEGCAGDSFLNKKLFWLLRDTWKKVMLEGRPDEATHYDFRWQYDRDEGKEVWKDGTWQAFDWGDDNPKYFLNAFK